MRASVGDRLAHFPKKVEAAQISVDKGEVTR